MHILFCVNNIKFGTKCFVKVEQFVLPFIHIADPGQTQSCIKVELLIPEISSERKTVLCDFRNTGIYAGASKAYKLKNIL